MTDHDAHTLDEDVTQTDASNAATQDTVTQDTELYVPVMLLPASKGRVFMAVLLLAVLGFLILSIVIKAPPASVLGIVFLLLLGAVCLYASYLVWQGADQSLQLTADELRDGNGKLLCLVKDIKSVERGTLAFKPSNGFMIVLSTKVARGWVPGLWWSFGSRIGVGGVTSAGAGKAMADVLAARVASLAMSE